MAVDKGFEEDWSELCTFLRKWYDNPDTDALRIILAVYVSHYYLSSPPIWLCLIGLPGSGKTEIGINPLSDGGLVQPVSEVTTNSFLSGFGDNIGILSNLKGKLKQSKKGDKESKNSFATHGILTFGDLTTTLLSKDPYTRGEIMGILRKIYDGYYERAVGNKKELLTWRGKVTCIAAATPNIEEYWAIYRDMGERWLSLKWGNLNPTLEDQFAMQEKAESHEGKEDEIRSTLRKMIQKILKNAGEGPEDTPKSRELAAMGILLEEMRVNVNREHTGRGYQVTDRGNKQFNTRTSKSLAMICKASATLRRSTEIGDVDIQLAKRVALNSIPIKRWRMVEKLIEVYPNPISKDELILATQFSRSTFDRVSEDLRHLEIIKIDEKTDENSEKIDILGDFGEGNKRGAYYYKRPTAKAQFSLNSNIVKVLQECKLLPTDMAHKKVMS